MIFCDEHETYSSCIKMNNLEFYNEKILMSENELIKLCCDTVDQSECHEWVAARKIRISASKSVHTINSLKKKTVGSLVCDMLYPKKFTSPSVQYGINQENNSRKEYEKIYKCQVIQIGLLVKKDQPWLCCSPDGIVCTDYCITKIVEFKCPYTCAKKPIFDDESQTCNVSYLYYENNEIQLKESHMYYTQCQLLMYVCGLTVYDFFVFTPVSNGSCCIEVHRDENFLKSAVLKSESFYFEHYLSVLESKLKKIWN